MTASIDGEFVGWRAARCETCNTVRPFRVEKLVRRVKLYDAAEVGRTDRGCIESCFLCGETREVSEEVTTTQNWEPAGSLEDLHRQTSDSAWNAVSFPDHRDHSDENVEFVLTKLHRHLKSEMKSAGGLGSMIGLLSGAATGGMIGASSHPFAWTPLILLGVLGAALGAWIELSIVGNKVASKMLKEALDTHQIPPRSLDLVCRKPGNNFGRISKKVSALQAQR